MRIKPILKWIGIVLGSLVGLATLAVAIIYLMIGSHLSKTFDVAIADADIAVPTDPASITEGERLARIHGCIGCHGADALGSVFFELPDGTKLIAPNLVKTLDEYSVAEFERVVRHGVRPDGSGVLLVMPSQMYANLSDASLGAIIAYLQTLEPGTGALPDTWFGPLARILLTMYKRETGSLLAADLISHDAPRLDPSPDNALGFGEYLAMTNCTECHGQDLNGVALQNIPPLSIVAAYSLENFATLMRTGAPIGGRKLELMEQVALGRYAHFTDAEISALHGFLESRLAGR